MEDLELLAKALQLLDIEARLGSLDGELLAVLGIGVAEVYERSGAWLFETGLPAKSGVSGGIITVAPGKVGMVTFSPPLDPAGNSVREQLATSFLSDLLGLNLFASAPADR